ncbi:MAG TPA: cytochrome c [Polyangiales bacterium]|nr:cytochrome c [Polyangiales bacterium]
MRWLFVLLMVAACGRKEGTPSSAQRPIAADELRPGPTNPGELSYRRYCIGCHAADGKGNGGTTGADLTAAESPLRTKSDDELLVSVREGKTGKVATMPAHKPVLNDAQIREILAFAHQRFAP